MLKETTSQSEGKQPPPLLSTQGFIKTHAFFSLKITIKQITIYFVFWSQLAIQRGDSSKKPPPPPGRPSQTA